MEWNGKRIFKNIYVNEYLREISLVLCPVWRPGDHVLLRVLIIPVKFRGTISYYTVTKHNANIVFYFFSNFLRSVYCFIITTRSYIFCK